MADDSEPAVMDPQIDGRRREQLRDRGRELAPAYTAVWDPHSEDPGTVLLELFADLASDVVERLDGVPRKHRLNFFDTLGFAQDPPQPATLPVALTVADAVGENVRVPAGTAATAEATDARPEQVFETREPFEATPADLARVYSVDPTTDAIYEHMPALEAGRDTQLFLEEQNLQQHTLYVGHVDRLALGPDATLQVTVYTDAAPTVLGETLAWEYFGEAVIDDEKATRWHRFTDVEAEPLSEAVLTRKRLERVTDEFLATSGQKLQATIEAGDQATVRRLVEGYLAELDLELPSPEELDARRRRAPERREGEAGSLLPERLAPGAAVADLRPQLLALVRLLVGAETYDALPTDVPEGVRLTMTVEGTVTETEVAGTKSRWIRCLIPEGVDSTDLFGLTFGPRGAAGGGGLADEGADDEIDEGAGDGTDYEPPVTIGSVAERRDPDQMLSNDVPMPTTDGTEAPNQEVVRPFGKRPRFQDTFYVASTDAFTKAGARATVWFDKPRRQPKEPIGDGGSDADEPTLSWEYFDGGGWERIDNVRDGTNRLQSGGPVTFEVPDDLAETIVSGHEGHWVRVRLVGGDYGELTVQKTNTNPETWTTVPNFSPPTFSSVAVSYSDEHAPAHLLAENNLAFGENYVAAKRERFHPFRGLPDERQTLYLGFDAPLDDGPINLLFDVADVEYPDDFYPGLRWECLADPQGLDWPRLDVVDETEGLTERGIVGLVFPEATDAAARFGTSLHWIRARVTRDRFEPLPVQDQTDTTAKEATRDCLPEPCGAMVRTAPPSGYPQYHRPTVRALVPNAAWAQNIQTVDDEVLGSSDGTQDQSFIVASPPVVDGSVWIDELAALTADDRSTLQATRPDDIRVEMDTAGDPTAFWVRWSREPDLLTSGPDDRHYTLDRTTGRVEFGDGIRGKIPPPGSDSVRATYRTGGGDGNVERGAVTGLLRSIPFVDSVTNPIAGDGGADVEPVDAVSRRASRELMDRDRAVTAADFERIATSSSRKLARARCLPGGDRFGGQTPGWVTLLIVPHGPDEKPVPSVSLKTQVHEAVAARAPVSLVEAKQLVVRGPSYVPVSVETTLVPAGVGSIAALEEAADRELAAFLDPLSGGPDGEGWAFGEVPCPSDCYALLEGLDGVDHVADFVLRFEGLDGVHLVHEGEAAPSVAPDVLVHSGTHDVEARLAPGDGRGVGGGERAAGASDGRGAGGP